MKDKKSRTKDISGMRSGKLTAVKIAVAGGSGKETIWECVCDCGNTVNFKVSLITRQARLHCGCVSQKMDLTGHRYGMLDVLYFDEINTDRTRWICKCDCGETCSVALTELRAGKTKSCGCLGRSAHITHGMTGTRPYSIYKNMLKRCDYEFDETTYNLYGGRGITYDPKWSTFEGFWEDMQEGYDDNLTLDRIDVNGNYTKENCRWVTGSIQSYNQRISGHNTSGRTGVSYYKSRDQWEAYISFEKKFIKLGYFNSFEEAVKAREEAELKYYGYIKE